MTFIMNKLKTRLATSGVLLSVFLLPLTSQDVHAYIDAGTGSLIIQILIAGFVGGIFLIKVFWGKVKAFLSNLFLKSRRGNG